MGKGSRNRQLHLQDKVDHPEKYNKKKKKQAPKWLTPAIGLLVVVAILVGVVANFVISSGIVKRSRVIIESQTGKFDVNQQIATFIAWNSIYQNSYYYYLYCQYGMVEDEHDITTTYDSGDQYALVAAQASISGALRDSVDDVLETLKIYVAVCDEAYRAGVKLDDADKEAINENIDALKSMQTSYGYGSFSGFLKAAMGEGMKKSDVEDALEMVSLYNKYCEQMQVTYEKAVTPADLEAYRNANPESFYKVDYLTYETDDATFKDTLSQAANAQEFKDLVLNYHLEDNYKTTYNKYITTEEAKGLLTQLSGVTNNNGNALTEALDSIGAGAAKDYKSDDTTINADLSKWLFDSARKEYESATVATDDGIYVVAILSKDENTVNARYVFLPFVEGVEHGDDKNFKENIFKYITESKKDEPALPEVDYKKATEKASAFETALKATDADIPNLLKDNNATDKTGVTSTTLTTEVPKVIRDAATKDGVKVGDILNVNDSGIYYVVYISAVESKTVNLSYVSFESDLYYQIIDDLTDSLDEVYPTDQTASYDADAEEGSFAEWISELTEKGKFVSARKENETKSFEEKDDDTTLYNVYMVIKSEDSDAIMYLDTETVVNGGYLLFDDEGFAEAAQTALETLQNKTNSELSSALYALDTSATVSVSLKETSVSDENLKAWLFSDDRQNNTSAKIDKKDGTGAYVAYFVEKTTAWEASAKSSFVEEKLSDWESELASKYTASEKVLDKLGEPTTTAENTGTGTGEDTTADEHEGHDHD